MASLATRQRRALAERVRSRAAGRCFFCGCQTHAHLAFTHPAAGSKDHLIPKALGGSDALDNLVWACRACNNAKGETTVGAFREHVGVALFYGEGGAPWCELNWLVKVIAADQPGVTHVARGTRKAWLHSVAGALEVRFWLGREVYSLPERYSDPEQALERACYVAHLPTDADVQNLLDELYQRARKDALPGPEPLPAELPSALLKMARCLQLPHTGEYGRCFHALLARLEHTLTAGRWACAYEME